MEAILDFSQPFNPTLLDQIISVFYNPQNPEQPRASKVLYDLKENDRSWTVADSIIENCHDPRSVFFGLILLEEMIQKKWLVVNPDQRESIKRYTLDKVMTMSATMESIEANEDILHKWDIILVEIFKKEWPNNWTSFVRDLVSSALESESRCRNSIFILKLVVEDVFQFSESTLTSQFTNEIQMALQKDMVEVYQLCTQVLVNTEVTSLLLDTMDIIRLIIKYLPENCVFDYQLAEVLIKFITLQDFQTSAMRCLHEILCHPLSHKYQSLVTYSLRQFVEFLKGYINMDMDLSETYNTLSSSLVDFVNELALFLTGVSLKHKSVLEGTYIELYLEICRYILFVSRAPDREILKICMSFWREWSQSIYNQFHNQQNPLGNPNAKKQPTGVFTLLTQQVIEFIISHMCRPEEMMMMENEDGEIVRVETKDTEGIALYKLMKESLVLLATVDFDITEAILLNFLDIQMHLGVNDSFRDDLQHLIWSIGSISGVMDEKKERHLLTGTIMDLLSLIKTKETKDDKAVIAGCLMYVIQQYPRFLKRHFGFLRVVIQKNFEFMHETHPGVQDMACDTFKKIVKNCGSQLIIVQNVEKNVFPPMINEILSRSQVYMEKLSIQQKEVFYEAVSVITKFERNLEKRLILIDNLLFPLNELMNGMIKAGVEQPMNFHTNENLFAIRNILRFNRVVCSVVTNDYFKQLSTHFQDFLDLFVLYSNASTATIKEKGDIAAGYLQTRNQLLIKREIIRILQTFIVSYTPRDNGNGEFVNLSELCNRFVPLLLTDFTNAPDCVKEPLTLQFLAAMIEKLKNGCKDLIPTILSSVYLSSLQLITSNRLQYSDLCLSFYSLMENLSKYSFQYIFAFAEQEQKMLVDSIIWGYKDRERSIYMSSLQTMITIMMSVRNCSNDFKQSFYRSFLVYIMEHTLDALTDSFHIPALNLLSELIHLLFTILESGEVSVPLFPDLNTPYQNPLSLCNHLSQFLFNKFPTCSLNIINDYIMTLGNSFKKSDADYKVINRDFLIQLKAVTNMNVDLYADEKETAKKQAEMADLERRKQIPGMVGVNEMPTEFDQY